MSFGMKCLEFLETRVLYPSVALPLRLYGYGTMVQQLVKSARPFKKSLAPPFIRPSTVRISLEKLQCSSDAQTSRTFSRDRVKHIKDKHEAHSSDKTPQKAVRFILSKFIKKTTGNRQFKKSYPFIKESFSKNSI